MFKCRSQTQHTHTQTQPPTHTHAAPPPKQVARRTTPPAALARVLLTQIGPPGTQTPGEQQATLDDHSKVVPRLPIPNRTVKRLCADDSGLRVCESRSSSGSYTKNPIV